MIGFDIDGVIADFNPMFHLEVERQTGIVLDEDPTTFNYELPGVSEKEIFQLVVDTINKRVNQMESYPGAIEALWRLYDNTREPIQFMTARSEELNGDATKKWLDERVVVPYEVQYVRSSKKADTLKEQGFTHFIDDRFRTVEQIKKVVPYTFLMDRTWNQGREAEGVYRVFDLMDYVTEYLNWRKA